MRSLLHAGVIHFHCNRLVAYNVIDLFVGLDLVHKKRFLNAGDAVIVIYLRDRGYVQIPAVFREYRPVEINGFRHDLPIFTAENTEIRGDQCFWVKATDIKNSREIAIIQRNLVKLQYEASYRALVHGFSIPQKIEDKELYAMAQQNAAATKEYIQRFGINPLEEEWIEKELALDEMEKLWFRYEREHASELQNGWQAYLDGFNTASNSGLSLEEAQALSKKYHRLILGAFWVRRQGIKDVQEWKRKALEFEAKHRRREGRMQLWYRAHIGKWPVVYTRRPVTFYPGPYFSECIERVPQVFETPHCNQVKAGVSLQVLAYDPEDHYISLDFMPEIAERIRGKPQTYLWQKAEPDYLIIVPPAQLPTHIEVNKPLSEV